MGPGKGEPEHQGVDHTRWSQTTTSFPHIYVSNDRGGSMVKFGLDIPLIVPNRIQINGTILGCTAG